MLRTTNLVGLALALGATLAACNGTGPVEDAAVEAGAGPLVCSHTLAGFCALQPAGTLDACDETWAAAEADRSACPPESPAIASWADCGAYDRFDVVGADTGYAYFYDATSGELTAVVSQGSDGSILCVGGPEDGFTIPSCPTVFDACVADGGAVDAR